MAGVRALKRLFAFCAVALFAWFVFTRFPHLINDGAADRVSGNAPVVQSIEVPADASQISGAGTVIRILPDDNEGVRHQRFILRLPSGKTLLVAHNIDMAPAVTSLREGDTVEYRGEYVSNPEGGVVHWTHHDPSGRHPSGWLKHNGQTFQ